MSALVTRSAPPLTTPAPRPPHLPLNALHVLMVEDDAEVREATQALLEDDGARVTAFAAAQPALDALATASGFDLLLTDVVLGGPLSGFDVAEAALRRYPRLPVLLATGYTGPAGAIPAALASVPLLLKPFRRIELLTAISAARQRAGTAGRAVAA